jgi:hypothetical protein
MSLDAGRGLRAAKAALALAGVPALLLFVLLGRPLEALPDYPAVLLAFLLTTALPGYFLQRALLTDTHPLVRLAAMPSLGLALIALPGFFALEAHTSIDTFAAFYAVVASIASGIAVFFWPEGLSRDEGAARRSLNPIVLAMALIVAGGIATTPYWAKDRVSGDFDDWTYMAYARDYVNADHVNEHEPFFGTDDPPTPRMRDNVWVLTTALIAKTGGSAPEGVLLEYLRPLLTLLVLLSTFALTWTLFKNSVIALLAALFQAGYGLIDLSPHEGMGRNLFVRISEDKMMGAFLLFPIALVFVARFVEKRTVASVVGFALIVLAIAFVHPVPLAFLGITIGTLAALRVVQDRDVRGAGWLLALLVPVAMGSIWPFVQRQLLQNSAPELFGTEESAITFRDAFRFTEIGHGLLIGNYHMIINPMVIAAIVLTPVVWLLARRSVGGDIVASMTGGALLAFFVPFIATPLSDLMTPQTLWKVPWIIPVGPVFAYLAYEGGRRFAAAQWFAAGRTRASAALVLTPAALLVVFLGAALLIQEQYIRADGGSYYDWRRGDSFLPGPDESIFLGGIDRGLSGTWRLDPFLRDLIGYMERNIPAKSVVLAEPQQLNHMIPGLLPDVYPLDFGGAAGEGERREAVNTFVGGNLDQSGLDGVIGRWGVDYIAARETQAANQHLITYYRVEVDAEVVPYVIYKVVR